MKLLTAMMGCALLAACNDPAATGNGAASAPLGPDPVEAQIAKLNPTQQRTAFFRAINDADYDCQNVVNVVSKGRVDGKPVWAVECNAGAQYVIALERGGIFKVSGVPKSLRR
ncbi:hypothetical protein [Sphingomonas hylomeconis]|uniref:Lipoprotein n=1 Tax=Sphingomonas hylomeconis TaxID=1395958 RepID=A0ABV7T0U3_9SPHN|nr:hypothetical protein [Sphingomonas hylomeconis]